MSQILQHTGGRELNDAPVLDPYEDPISRFVRFHFTMLAFVSPSLPRPLKLRWVRPELLPLVSSLPLDLGSLAFELVLFLRLAMLLLLLLRSPLVRFLFLLICSIVSKASWLQAVSRQCC